MKALLKSRLWIPIRAVDKEYLETEFLVRNFEDRQCDKCEYRPDRFCDVCAECPAFLGEVKLWREKGEYVGVPTGDRKALKRLLIKPVEIKDSRSKPKMRFGLSLTVPLRDYQKKPVEEMVEKGFGILNAPPRSGKTLMAIAIGLALGVRMMIMSAQRDWLNQFLTEFKEHTDFLEVAKFHGKPVVLITNDVAQMRASNADVILSTYQSFISKTGKKRLQEIKDLFGLVVIDECHGIPADAYAQVVAAFNARYRIGLTATPERKDCLPAGTLVAMYDGTTKKIEDVKVGDLVKTYSHAKKVTETQTVIETHQRPDSQLYEVTHEHGVLRCTGDHELWCVNRQKYVKAKDLTSDDELLVNGF